MFHDVYLSIFLLASATFMLGGAVASWIFVRREDRKFKSGEWRERNG